MRLETLLRALRNCNRGHHLAWRTVIDDRLLLLGPRGALNQPTESEAEKLAKCMELLNAPATEQSIRRSYERQGSHTIDIQRLIRNARGLVSTARLALSAKLHQDHALMPRAAEAVANWAELPDVVHNVSFEWLRADPIQLVNVAFDALASHGVNVLPARVWTTWWLSPELAAPLSIAVPVAACVHNEGFICQLSLQQWDQNPSPLFEHPEMALLELGHALLAAIEQAKGSVAGSLSWSLQSLDRTYAREALDGDSLGAAAAVAFRLLNGEQSGIYDASCILMAKLEQTAPLPERAAGHCCGR